MTKTERYEKRGSSLRFEWHRGEASLLRSSESGVAEESSGTFRTFPRPGDSRVDFPDEQAVAKVGQELCALVPPSRLERLIIVNGYAQHLWSDGDQERAWVENSFRIHLQTVNETITQRLTVDRGGPEFVSRDVAEVRALVDAFDSVRIRRATTVHGSLLLSPSVAALIWSGMAKLPRLASQPGIALAQTTHETYKVDGRGQPVVTQPLFSALGSSVKLPNVFRPSYRYPPAAVPFHVRLTGLVVNSSPNISVTAIGCLSPVTVTPEELHVVLLCRRSVGHELFAAQMRVNPEGLLERVMSEASSYVQWFPFGAGAYGASTVVDDIELEGI